MVEKNIASVPDVFNSAILFNGEGDGSYSFITKEGKNYIVIQLNELKSDMEITIQ